MKRRIEWVKWRDPLAAVLARRPAACEDEDGEAYGLSMAGFDDEQAPNGHVRGGPGPCLVSPIGLVPLHESNLPSKLFNFWMGHTSFDITHAIKERIAAVPGVESLDVFTRYRFRLAVGQAFNDGAVRRAVEEAICKEAPASEPVTAASGSRAALRQLLARKHRFWAIVSLPGGQVRFEGGDSAAEVEDKLLPFQGAAESVEKSW